MDAPSSPVSALTRRVTQACERCRTRKVRCSGQVPCISCRRVGFECVFSEAERRISVSARYLRELQHRDPHPHRPHARRRPDVPRCPSPAPPLPSPPPLQPSHAPLSALPSDPAPVPVPTTPCSNSTAPSALPSEPGDAFTHNPLTGNPPTVHALNQQWYLGPSSTWSFSRRVTDHLERAFPYPPQQTLPINLDGAAYDLPPLPPRPCVDEIHLPSLDHAIYLFNTVKFHLNQRFRFVDERPFTERLHAFYSRDARVDLSPLAYAELMFVLAFGKAFLSNSRDENTPKGWAHAAQGFALLPTFHTHDQDNILAIEVYCLAALYLQSIDMRVTALDFVGRALRLCYVVGIHRDLHGKGIPEPLAARCGELWWSVYMLDLHISALMGAPSAIQEKDMTVRIPPASGVGARASALGIHVTLSRVLARLMRTVYAVQSPLDGSYLADAQDILKALAELSHNIDDTIAMSSLLSSHLSLYHHHCVVLATRPIIICILARLGGNISQSNRIRPPTIAGPASALLQACLHSAVAIVLALAKLQEEDLLETFLPFHLEQVFSSAYVLYMAQKLMPHNCDFDETLLKSEEILLAMVAGGNRLARVRVTELDHLRSLLSRFTVTAGDLEKAPNAIGSHDVDTNFAELGLLSWTASGSELGNDAFRPTDLHALSEFLDLPDVSGQMMFSPL